MKSSEKQKIPYNVVYELCIETTKLLNENQDKLEKIKWTDGEANIDTEYSELACNCCYIAWNIIKHKYPEYKEINITCKIPDINITFIYPNRRNEKYKIELKSSKSKKMPGSTIKNLDINQPLIYCLRPSNNSKIYKVRCSQYYNAIGESNTDLFQDRTPRPHINFEKMNENLPFKIKDKNCWIEHYANCALNRIHEKNSCKNSWQDDMIKIIQQKIIEEYIRNTTNEQFQIDKVDLQVKKLSI
jgi:hypothetical protein